MHQNEEGGSTAFTVALATYPILSMYGFSAISFGDIFLLISLIMPSTSGFRLLITNYKPIKMQWIFLSYCIIGALLSSIFCESLLLGSVIKRILKQGFYYYIITISRENLCKSLFISTYRKIVWLTFVGLILQYVFYYALGHVLVIKIPFIPYSGVVTEEGIASKLSWKFRPSSFYAEPGACCYVLLPFLIYVLFHTYPDFSNRRRRDIIITTASILMTVSSAGIVCCAIIYAGLLIKLQFNRNVSLEKKLIQIMAVLMIGITVVYIISITPLKYSFTRMFDSENELATQNVWGKTTGGQVLFDNISGIQKIIGVGFGNLSMNQLSNYTNSVFYILYTTGYIGLGLIVIWLISVFASSDFSGKISVVVFAALCVSARIIISSLMMIFSVYFLIEANDICGTDYNSLQE